MKTGIDKPEDELPYAILVGSLSDAPHPTQEQPPKAKALCAELLAVQHLHKTGALYCLFKFNSTSFAGEWHALTFRLEECEILVTQVFWKVYLQPKPVSTWFFDSVEIGESLYCITGIM